MNKNEVKKTNNAHKAAFLSALVFPGAGLWWLKKYSYACLFIIPTLGALLYLVKALYSYIAPPYQKMLRDAEDGLLVVNPSNMTSLYTKLHDEIYTSLAAHHAQLQFAEIILVAAWLGSIAVSYAVGKKMDSDNSTSNL